MAKRGGDGAAYQWKHGAKIPELFVLREGRSAERLKLQKVGRSQACGLRRDEL